MSNITKVRIKQTDGTYSEEYPIGVSAENVDMGNSTNLSTKISTMDTAINGKAPTNHASANTTYGVATSAAYGHVKIVDNYMTVPQATGPFAASTQAVVNAYTTLNNNKAPNDHASSNTTYGVATSGAYGHVKIVDNYMTVPQATGPFAASTQAVVNAYTALNTNKAPSNHASSELTYGAATNVAYGHVKISDNLVTPPEGDGPWAATSMAVCTAYGLANTANSAASTLNNTLNTLITPKLYTLEDSSGWSPTFGGSFSSTDSICYIRQTMDHIFMVTFAVYVSTTISASVNRNVITNLPLASTRMYIPATVISYDNGPTTTKNIVLAIRPQESAANSGRILKIEAGLNPYTLVTGDVIYSTFILMGDK